MSKADGFTLIETLVAVTVFAIALSIAVPAFSRLIGRSHLRTAGNALIGALTVARQHAASTGQTTLFCGTSLSGNAAAGPVGAACGVPCGAVYTTTGSGPPKQIHAPVSPGGEVVVGGATPTLTYTLMGIARQPGHTAPYTGLVADLHTADPSRRQHLCIYMATGSTVSSCHLPQTCPQDAPASCR